MPWKDLNVARVHEGKKIISKHFLQLGWDAHLKF